MWWRSKKPDSILKSLDQLFSKFEQNMNDQLSLISKRLSRMEEEIVELNQNLRDKDLKDKQSFGHLTYKLMEIKKDSGT
jgi:uncharacterized protein (UPF0335 family)